MSQKYENSSSFEILQIIGLCVATLVVGATMGMYIEKILSFKSKKNFDSDMNAKLTEQEKEMLKNKPEKVPKHIAVIMDGNRRFGRQTHSDPLQVCLRGMTLSSCSMLFRWLF